MELGADFQLTSNWGQLLASSKKLILNLTAHEELTSANKPTTTWSWKRIFSQFRWDSADILIMFFRQCPVPENLGQSCIDSWSIEYVNFNFLISVLFMLLSLIQVDNDYHVVKFNNQFSFFLLVALSAVVNMVIIPFSLLTWLLGLSHLCFFS